MSMFSKFLGLDHPSNKGLLDVLNGVGRAIATTAGIPTAKTADPATIVLQALLQKYAPSHVTAIMSEVGTIASGIETAEALAAPKPTPAATPVPHPEPTPAPTPSPSGPVASTTVTPAQAVQTVEQTALISVENAAADALSKTRTPLFQR